MEKIMKSLIDIAKNNELPIKVTYSTGTVYMLLCINDDGIACTHTERTVDKIIRRSADIKQWKVWTEPQPVPHWPAVRTTGAKYSVSNTVYSSEEEAKQYAGSYKMLSPSDPRKSQPARTDLDTNGSNCCVVL